MTASADGQPYARAGAARAGPSAWSARTLGFADMAGNRQYISIGNLAENPKAFLFLMDYARRRRVKLWAAPAS